ncbi:UDP-N-acetylglucosamine 2-epimerase [Candidatus Scalindua japonica]|uniref:UDP-N-acetylglucosamine 2-epimerase n=1 Tax=Candidatus Scalindua japonica TaxID=1284222 RepID=A0A286U498_9BACT|nr:UDP-N-acetylglucosamine 2-epimerase (non-hydrolyzing) [Candidatus Scalindua japonica]GAX62955.1 UDP-N-acetylglucosamine 2-epimerase [Candidatus Scalindua japonica]
MKIIHVVGARPNFMKIAPLMDAVIAHNHSSKRHINQVLVHTGQHYDEKMSRLFFDDLRIPKPDIDLEVGSASHAEQTALIMERFEKVCLREKPTHVLVVGDVNSTIACALVASKLNIRIIHVEAGLRSYDRTMPEEINRVLTDAISDLLFITEKSAEENLKREGVNGDKIFFVGNVMIDTLLKHKEKSQESDILNTLRLKAQDYAVITLHRPSNVDDQNRFKEIFSALNEISGKIPLVFPIHPRAKSSIDKLNGGVNNNITFCEPLRYLDFLKVMSDARFILTDSGGIQEETTVLGIPCLTIRENTERPVTISQGTNKLVGTGKERIVQEAENILYGNTQNSMIPELWDGKAAERIVKILAISEK